MTEEMLDQKIASEIEENKYNDSSRYFYKHYKDGSSIIIEKKTGKIVRKWKPTKRNEVGSKK